MASMPCGIICFIDGYRAAMPKIAGNCGGIDRQKLFLISVQKYIIEQNFLSNKLFTNDNFLKVYSKPGDKFNIIDESDDIEAIKRYL
jgi:hypothetical protein